MRRSAGEDGFVGGLDVGMGSDDGSCPTITVEAEGDFFAGDFSVEVYKNMGGVEGRKEVIERLEGIVVSVHVDSSAYIDNSKSYALTLYITKPSTGTLLWDIYWSDDGFVPIEIVVNFSFVKCVIAKRDSIGAVIKQSVCNFRSDPKPGGRILAVHDGEGGFVFSFESRKVAHHRFSAWSTHDIAEKKDFVGFTHLNSL